MTWGGGTGMKLGFGKTLERLSARLLARLALAIMGTALFAGPALAANCNVATSQGSTGPSIWQTYYWIDFSTYNDTTARTVGGQPFSLTLQNGTIITFTLKVTTPSALTAITSPSWTGAAVGNSAFLGIVGKPVICQTAGGTSTVTFSNIERPRLRAAPPAPICSWRPMANRPTMAKR